MTWWRWKNGIILGVKLLSLQFKRATGEQRRAEEIDSQQIRIKVFLVASEILFALTRTRVASVNLHVELVPVPTPGLRLTSAASSLQVRFSQTCFLVAGEGIGEKRRESSVYAR